MVSDPQDFKALGDTLILPNWGRFQKGFRLVFSVRPVLILLLLLLSWARLTSQSEQKYRHIKQPQQTSSAAGLHMEMAVILYCYSLCSFHRKKCPCNCSVLPGDKHFLPAWMKLRSLTGLHFFSYDDSQEKGSFVQWTDLDIYLKSDY